jgi:hypothetical protein
MIFTKDIRNRDREKSLVHTLPVQYLNNRSHGMDRTSGQAEPIAQYFIKNLTTGFNPFDFFTDIL